MQKHRPNSTVVMTAMLRKHPLGFPLSLVILGSLILAAAWSGASTSVGHEFTRIAALGGLALAVGVLILPFGIAMAIRRKTRKVSLECPACGYRMSGSGPGFSVERPGYLDYAVATCPKCSWVFETEKYATLT